MVAARVSTLVQGPSQTPIFGSAHRIRGPAAQAQGVLASRGCDGGPKVGSRSHHRITAEQAFLLS
eukprot:4796084-Alexandrium_andersonii.AAC.1